MVIKKLHDWWFVCPQAGASSRTEVASEESEGYEGLIVSRGSGKAEVNATNADSSLKAMNETSGKAKANKTTDGQIDTAAHTLPNPVRYLLMIIKTISNQLQWQQFFGRPPVVTVALPDNALFSSAM